MKYFAFLIVVFTLSCTNLSSRTGWVDRQPSATAEGFAFLNIDPFVIKKDGVTKDGQKMIFISLDMSGLMDKIKERGALVARPLKMNVEGMIGTDQAKLYPLYKITGITASSADPCRGRPLKILITAGVHGNEPIGVITAFDLMNDLAAREPQIRVSAEWTIMPLLNIEGLISAKRLMNNKQNLNRTFDEKTWTETSRAIAATWQSKDFDVAIDLHGSNVRKQFFLIKTTMDDRGVGRRALAALPTELLLHTAQGATQGYVGAPTENDTVDNERYLLESAGLASSSNEGTIKNYLLSRGTQYAYTLEYPGSLGYDLARENNFRLLRSLLQEAANQICGR